MSDIHLNAIDLTADAGDPTTIVTPGSCRTRNSTSTTWEQRWHPIREEWVIVAAHRDRRPWSGSSIARDSDPLPHHDPRCPLCPGNRRVNGTQNDHYPGVFVFDNDAPCVSPTAPQPLEQAPGIYRHRPATGASRVICYGPLHNVSLAELSLHGIAGLLNIWQNQYRELGDRPEVNHLLVFENRGAVVGVSNPHPHCQIHATNFVFKAIAQEASVCARYWNEHRRGLMEAIVDTEQRDGRRIICAHDSVVAFVPYFARYAYETYIVPKQQHASLADLSAAELNDLAVTLQDVLIRFDNLWKMPFPYVMMLHQAPTDGAAHAGFHFHIEFYPPLRKPNLLKYLAGPEAGGGNFISDTAPEEKATELRAQSTIHYKRRRV